MKNPLKKIFKVVLRIVIVAAIIVAGFFIYCKFFKPKEITYVAIKADYEEKINVKGTIDTINSAEVYSKSSNKIKEILVVEGDIVSKGDTLAYLDDDKTHEYDRAELNYKEAKRSFDIAEKLYNAGDISQDEYIKTENVMNLAKVALESLDISEDLAVKSPIDGIVTKIDAKIGMVAGGIMPKKLFQVEDISKLQIKVDIKEKDLSKVKIGAKASITSDAMGDRVFYGKVSYISPVGEASGNFNTKKIVSATIDINENEKNITAGVSAKADISVNKYENVLIIPIECLVEEADLSYVYVKDNYKKKKIIVSPLVVSDDEFIIKDNGTITGDDIIFGVE